MPGKCIESGCGFGLEDNQLCSLLTLQTLHTSWCSFSKATNCHNWGHLLTPTRNSASHAPWRDWKHDPGESHLPQKSEESAKPALAWTREDWKQRTGSKGQTKNPLENRWWFLTEGVLLFISSCKSSTQSLERMSWLSTKVFFPKYFAVLTLKASPGVLFQYQQHQIVPQGSPGSLVHTRTPQGYIHISLPKESRARDIRKGMHSLCGFFTQCQDVVKMPSFDKDCNRDLEKTVFRLEKEPHILPPKDCCYQLCSVSYSAHKNLKVWSSSLLLTPTGMTQADSMFPTLPHKAEWINPNCLKQKVYSWFLTPKRNLVLLIWFFSSHPMVLFTWLCQYRHLIQLYSTYLPVQGVLLNLDFTLPCN